MLIFVKFKFYRSSRIACDRLQVDLGSDQAKVEFKSWVRTSHQQSESYSFNFG